MNALSAGAPWEAIWDPRCFMMLRRVTRERRRTILLPRIPVVEVVTWGKSADFTQRRGWNHKFILRYLTTPNTYSQPNNAVGVLRIVGVPIDTNGLAIQVRGNDNPLAARMMPTKIGSLSSILSLALRSKSRPSVNCDV